MIFIILVHTQTKQQQKMCMIDFPSLHALGTPIAIVVCALMPTT